MYFWDHLAMFLNMIHFYLIFRWLRLGAMFLFYVNTPKMSQMEWKWNNFPVVFSRTPTSSMF